VSKFFLSVFDLQLDWQIRHLEIYGQNCRQNHHRIIIKSFIMIDWHIVGLMYILHVFTDFLPIGAAKPPH